MNGTLNPGVIASSGPYYAHVISPTWAENSSTIHDENENGKTRVIPMITNFDMMGCCVVM